MDLVQLFNKLCQPTRQFQNLEQCTQYTQSLKMFLVNQENINIETFLMNRQEKWNLQEFTQTQKISAMLLGEAKEELSQADVIRIQIALEKIVSVYNVKTNLLQSIKPHNQIQQKLQELVNLVTQDPTLNLENINNAIGLIKTVRERANDFENKQEFMEILIKDKQAFNSDFRQFFNIIQDTFYQDEDMLMINSAQMICQYYTKKVRQFEDNYQTRFRYAINKCFDRQMPVYQDCIPTEFLMSSEKKAFCQVIQHSFGLHVDRPLYFYKSYFKQLLGIMRKKTDSTSSSLADCIVKLLNTQQNEYTAIVYEKISAKQQKFTTVDEFVKASNYYLDRFNRKHDIKLDDLCKFAIYEYLQRNPDNNNLLDVDYSYNIFVTKNENLQIERLILDCFDFRNLFKIVEKKNDEDSYQPLFIVEALIKKLTEILEQLSFKKQNEGENIFDVLDKYCEHVVEMIFNQFHVYDETAKKQKKTFSSLEKLIKNFNSDYTYPKYCYPFKYALQLYQKQFDCQFENLNKVSNYISSDFTTNLNMQFNTKITLIDIYVNIILKIRDKSAEPILIIFDRLMKENVTTQIQVILYKIFGISSDVKTSEEFKIQIDKYMPRILATFKDTLTIFNYDKILIQKNDYCVENSFVKPINQICQKMLYKASPDFSINLLLNFVKMFDLMKQDFQNLLIADKQEMATDFITLLSYVNEMRTADSTLCVKSEDSVFQKFARLFCPADQFGSMLLEKPSKFNYVMNSISVLRDQTNNNNTPLNEIFQVIDPNNCMDFYQFTAMIDEMYKTQKFTGQQEKIFKLYVIKFYNFYMLNKKIFGAEINSFSTLYNIIKRQGAVPVTLNRKDLQELVGETPQDDNQVQKADDEKFDVYAGKSVEEKAEIATEADQTPIQQQVVEQPIQQQYQEVEVQQNDQQNYQQQDQYPQNYQQDQVEGQNYNYDYPPPDQYDDYQ